MPEEVWDSVKMIYESACLSIIIFEKGVLTLEAQQVGDKHQLQSQLEFYHLYHQKDMTMPNMHQSRLLHHLNG